MVLWQVAAAVVDTMRNTTSAPGQSTLDSVRNTTSAPGQGTLDSVLVAAIIGGICTIIGALIAQKKRLADSISKEVDKSLQLHREVFTQRLQSQHQLLDQRLQSQHQLLIGEIKNLVKAVEDLRDRPSA